jgi:hypothetical protein
MTYKVNETSWHYKFNIFTYRFRKPNATNRNDAEYLLQEEATDFCSYWRETVGNFFVWIYAFGTLLFILFLLALLTFLLFLNLKGALVFLFLFAIALGTGFLFSMGVDKLSKKFAGSNYEFKFLSRENIFLRAYQNWKDKTCEKIEYVKKDN